jgi:cell division protein FtsQ
VEDVVAIARWGDGALVNQQGTVFKPDDISMLMQLPFLSGPAGKAKEVMEQYLQFNHLLYPLGLRIRDLAMSARGAWTLTLTNGIVVRLGHEEVVTRLRRLVVFLQTMGVEQLDDVAALDLRYHNGVAVEHGMTAAAAQSALVAR